MTMKSANLGNLDHMSAINFVDLAMFRTVHLKRQVCT
jgi:hypothetical protein